MGHRIPPLALRACREFVTPLHVSLNGLEEVDEGGLQRRLDREDANRDMDDNEVAELEDSIYRCQRICNLRLPLFLQDESEDEFAEVAHRAGKRRAAPGFDDAAAAELSGRKRKAKAMRETARRRGRKARTQQEKLRQAPRRSRRHSSARVAHPAPQRAILGANGRQAGLPLQRAIRRRVRPRGDGYVPAEWEEVGSEHQRSEAVH